jgi:beta-glucosidase-like glycosyl hydrolase
MVAHLSLPNIDPSGVPATYSSLIIGGQLREALDYHGLIITDDLEMGGASISKDVGERAIRAFLAGNDMLMFAGTMAHQRRAYAAVLNAVKSGRIPMSRLNESVARILAAKSHLRPQPSINYAKMLAAFKKMDSLSKKVLKRNFNVAAEEAKHDWPDMGTDSDVTVYSASYYFFRKFQHRFKGKAHFYLLKADSLDDAKQKLESSRSDFAIFFASGKRTAHWLNTLTADLRGKLIVVNTTNQGEIEHQSEFMSIFNINSYFTDSGTWLGDLLNQPPPDEQNLRLPAATAGDP